MHEAMCFTRNLLKVNVVSYVAKNRRSELKLSNAYHVPGVMKNLLSVTDGKYVLFGPNDVQVFNSYQTSSTPILKGHKKENMCVLSVEHTYVEKTREYQKSKYRPVALPEQLDLFEVSRVVVEMVDAVITFPFVAFLLSYIRILVMKMMDIYFIKLHSLFFKNTNEFLSTGGWYLVERLGVPQSKVYGPKNGMLTIKGLTDTNLTTNWREAPDQGNSATPSRRCLFHRRFGQTCSVVAFDEPASASVRLVQAEERRSSSDGACFVVASIRLEHVGSRARCLFRRGEAVVREEEADGAWEQLDLFEVSRVVVEVVDAVITFLFVAFLLSYIRIVLTIKDLPGSRLTTNWRGMPDQGNRATPSSIRAQLPILPVPILSPLAVIFSGITSRPLSLSNRGRRGGCVGACSIDEEEVALLYDEFVGAGGEDAGDDEKETRKRASG
ncbi:hypothetical protein E3N88_29654 [Mikania micrantha]|uniref:Uncharacterized protein n=1 Tax=Mikania micrantha TaxID=192012 RepID=A0A5N6MJF7_9ASTR|nr:hypothetical protein E3N88_29654 [Mikania micrantha]